MIARVSRSKKSSPRPSRAEDSADEECRNSLNTAELGPMQEQYIPSRLPTPVRASNHQPENFLVIHADIKRFIKRYSSLLKWSTAIGILLGAAYAGFAEDKIGSLAPGKWADFIIVDRDPTQVDAQSLAKTQVLETWVAGKKVWSSASGRPERGQ